MRTRAFKSARWVFFVSLAAGCRPPPAATPSTDTAAAAPRGGDACLREAAAGHDDRSGFQAIVLHRFEGWNDRDRGVVFIDAWEDEGEEPRPKVASVVCGEDLQRQLEDWTTDLAHRLEADEAFACSCDRCVHEAAEGMDFRGEYRFDAGRLRVVAHTSGPPGHIDEPLRSMDQRFIGAAVDALGAAPCDTRYTRYPTYDPSLDGPAD